MHRHFGESNIVIDFNANKRWTTVSTVRSIKQRSMMAKEDSFERSFGIEVYIPDPNPTRPESRIRWVSV